MKTLFLSIALVFSFSTLIYSESGIKIFEHNGFHGKSIQIHGDWDSQDDPDWNDRISSIQVTDGWKIMLYTKPDFEGEYYQIKSDWNAVGSFSNWNDKINSIKIIRNTHSKVASTNYRPPAAKSVKVYKNSDFTGEAKLITSDWNTGNYPDNLNWGGKINAIIVPEGWGIRAFSFNSFIGDHIDITGNWSSDDSPGWHNKISSIQIIRKTNLDQFGRVIDPGIIVYKHDNFSGESRVTSKDWDMGSYPDNINWGDKINSIRIPEGYAIRIFSFNNYLGDYIEIADDWSSKDYPEWKNKISSIKVVNRP